MISQTAGLLETKTFITLRIRVVNMLEKHGPSSFSAGAHKIVALIIA